jgi:hypothetical protein
MIELTSATREWLASFDRLPAEEQLLAAKEIQRRVEKSSHASAKVDFSPLSDGELACIADELFQMSDAEEASRNA